MGRSPIDPIDQAKPNYCQGFKEGEAFPLAIEGGSEAPYIPYKEN